MMGDTPFHHRIRALCAEFVDIFSREVKPTPAKVAPLELHLKPNAKFLKTIGGGPRIQSPAKSAEIKRQLEQMLRLGVIQPSTSLTYSQVTLAPKPHSDKWRFCVDYRELNEDLESLYYVIPNIRSMMQRIGSKKPKKMGTVDCTSGYHQTSLSERSRQYAAFVTEFGVFEPVRVPFGIHVAPSYFQKTMATTVIGGELLFNNVDLYIDDILLYAQDDDEFLDILRKLFVRCRQFNITLHPDKCKLGVEEIEYVGHVIDKDGMHMSEEKIRKVLEFEKPSTVREMQSFLGLANYFRDHIRNHSTIAQPLYGMYNSKSDKGGKRLIWDDITTKAYNNLKKSIENCPKLYFLEDKTRSTEIFVETDASDYGIGAYLYQQRIGETVQRPVAFISKALSTTERRWSTIEKEQYAIYYALRQWEYLLKGIPFTIRTDHKNLEGRNMNTPKVVRWKLALQEFDAKVEHIAGKLNERADTLSRLVETDIQRQETKALRKSNPLHETVTVVAAIGFEDTPIPNDKYTTIAKYHNSKCGHMGVEKTLRTMKKHETPWYQMKMHIKRFIRECPICQKSSFARRLHNVATYTVASYAPMQRLSVDTIGPLLHPLGEQDFKYILVIIDNFTRFVTLHPCISTGAEEAAHILLNHIGTFGTPESIQSDKGSQFVNDTIQYMVKRMGIEWIANVAYSKQENGIVERANKEVLRHLKTFIYDINILKKWIQCLPLVQRILNATVHDTTGLAPAQILFGNAVDLDRGIFLDYHGKDLPDKPTTDKANIQLRQYVDELWSKQQELMELARSHQKQHDEEHKIANAPKGPITEYPPQTLILLSYPDRPPSKLHMPWKGPRRVLKQEGPHVTVQNILNGNTETVHINTTKPFYHDPLRIDPKVVASKDDQERFVETVLWHVGDFTRKRELKFKVKFLGEEVANDDEGYLYWRELRNVTALHEYLQRHNLHKHIPKNLEEWAIGPMPTIGIPHLEEENEEHNLDPTVAVADPTVADTQQDPLPTPIILTPQPPKATINLTIQPPIRKTNRTPKPNRQFTTDIPAKSKSTKAVKPAKRRRRQAKKKPQKTPYLG
jgi:transposase InsO family protein